MNTLRKILNNLQKYSTTVTTVKYDIKAVTPLFPEEQSLEDTHLDKDTLEFEIGVNAATPQTIETKECLKEFDDILEEINNSTTLTSRVVGASLDDIDDVLKDMAQEDPKDFILEVPKFDLAEISAAFENLRDDIDESLISLDESIVSFSDIYIPNSNEDIEQNNVISISSENSPPKGRVKNISTENIEQNIHVDSMNTEETKENIKHSQSIECEKLDNKYISGEKDQGIEIQSNFHVETNIEQNIHVDSMDTEESKENIKICDIFECKKLDNNLTTKDVVFMDDSDDGGYQSSDFEFITEEEAKMDGLIINLKKNTHKRKTTEVNKAKNIEIAVDQFFKANKLPKRNYKKRKTRNIDKDPDWAPKSDTDSTSDDEFIPDDMQYLSRNNTRSKNNNMHGKSPERNNTVTFNLRQIRIPPRRYIGSARFSNLQINSEGLTSRNVNEYNVDVRQNIEEGDSPGRNDFRGFSNGCRNKLATMKMEANFESNLCKTETGELAHIDYPIQHFNPDLPKKEPDSIKDIPGSSFMQEIQPESSKIITNKMQDRPELNNIATLKSPEKNKADPRPGQSQSPEGNTIPGTSTENVPDPIKCNPGPSGMQDVPKLDNFRAGPSCTRNRSHVDEIEKWRMYQMRNRLNRPQFVVDYSYRDHHRIYEDNDLHQLFDPNRAPLPTARSMRLLENKSTVCKNSMLVEYQGVGFNVPLRRDSWSEDDEAKREANECAQKILEMYPGQNTIRSRRRRF